ncbi:sulfite exporter TauE/SafE family protein [Micromonospora soli]|uniref:sulfite exporter TauE/SafE family protein n=1 Tax=Micromonospora sp. NBRC 110009 TaxID=3061627 RepID=UPI0026723C28|nr:sulfite exporter TauE/SafE family protein [Micromonospora sp. NBRC 110009]WKT96504.1 sulfite exporter TauE/SafE family protein [Micromonospora sp. NBRC 110009]
MVVLLVAFGIVLLGAVAQAVSGFGYALVTVPLLAAALDPRGAVVVSALTGIGVTLIAAVRERAYARWRVALALTGSAVLGLPVGLLVLAYAPERVLRALIAVVVLGCVALVWSGARFRTGRVGLGSVGVLVGVLTAATGTNGPPLVAAFHSLGYDPRTFRATIAATFAGTGLMGLAGFAATGQVHADVVRTALVALPAVPLGWWLGNRLFHRIAPVVFRRIVLFGLLGSAGAALAGLAGLAG